MAIKNGIKEVYIFSQPKSYIFIVNNGGKISLGLLIAMISIALIKSNNMDSIFRSLQIIIFLCLLIYVTGIFLKKFAYKIIVDFKSKNIKFFINRRKDFIEFSFDEIKNIRVNGYIIFTLNRKKILFSAAPSKDILSCLNRIKKIDWGFLGAVLGPSKELRDVLE
jgi:hypothetical protein